MAGADLDEATKKEIKGNVTGYIEEEKDLNEEDEEVAKPLSDELARRSLQGWVNLSSQKQQSSNTSCLADEAIKTFQYMENYMKSLENYARATARQPGKHFRVRNWSFARTLDQVFQERIDLGMFVIDRISQLERLERMSPTNITLQEINTEEVPTEVRETSKDSSNTSNNSAFEVPIQNFTARFARVLDSRGIKHNLSVSKSAMLLLERGSGANAKAEHTQKPLFYEDSLISEDSEDRRDEIEQDACEFLDSFAESNEKEVTYRELAKKEGKKLTGKPREYCIQCQFASFSALGKGPRKEQARLHSASNMLKIILKEHERGTLKSKNLKALGRGDTNRVVAILCQTENYVLYLKRACETRTAHLPVYNVLGEKPVYKMRCHALGYSAVGSNKRQKIAKRIAAKNLIDKLPIGEWDALH